MKLYHREISPSLFKSPYIVRQVLILLRQAEKEMKLTKHAALKANSYLWCRNGNVRRNGITFHLSQSDIKSVKTPTFFSALLEGCSVDSVFEIELHNDNRTINKIVLRTELQNSPDTDIILVIAGQLKDGGFEFEDIRLKTWYLNQRHDNHRTLKRELYLEYF